MVFSGLRFVLQARALLEWHNTVRFCGYCGSQTVSAEAGRRKQCSNESCKKRIYPRVDPVCDVLFCFLGETWHVFCSKSLISSDLMPTGGYNVSD